MEDSQKWWSGNANSLWETACWFSVRCLKPLPQILNIVGCFHWTRSTTVNFIGICDTYSLRKFGHQTFHCSSIRCFVPAKISPALPLCHNHRFCGEVRLYYCIFVRCCIIQCPLLSILTLLQFPRPTVYTAWKIKQKLQKHKFGSK